MADGREKSILDVVDESVRSALMETHTALPGRIDAFDPVTQTATVAVELQREIENAAGVIPPTRIEPVPVLLDVPVLFPRAGGFSITFPVAVGDKCLVLFAERDLSGWIQTGGEALPASARRHSYSDAVAILGLSPGTNPITPAPSGSALQIRSDDGDIAVEISAAGVAVKAGDGASGATIDTTVGPFAVSAVGAITLTRGANELLAVISAALAAISAAVTSDGATLNVATVAAINAQKALIDAIRT